MAEAIVTVKLTPTEFDTVRAALEVYRDTAKEAYNTAPDGRSRQKAGQDAGRATDLLERLA